MVIRVAVGVFGVAVGIVVAPLAAAEPAVPADPAVPPAPAAVLVDAPSAIPAETQEVAHLPSPDNLPPGTTQTAPERRTLGYLRDIWQVIRTEDVTMGDALLLLAQRPMSAVPPGMSPRQEALPTEPAIDPQTPVLPLPDPVAPDPRTPAP